MALLCSRLEHIERRGDVGVFRGVRLEPLEAAAVVTSMYVMPPDSFDTIAMWKSVATASVPDLNMWSGLIVAVYTVSDHLT